MSGILGQAAPIASALTDLYTVPADTVASMRIIVTNRAAVDATFRVSLAPAGAVDAVAQYIAFDKPILANDTGATVAFIVSSTDVVRVESDNGNLSFNAVGETRKA